MAERPRRLNMITVPRDEGIALLRILESMKIRAGADPEETKRAEDILRRAGKEGVGKEEWQWFNERIKKEQEEIKGDRTRAVEAITSIRSRQDEREDFVEKGNFKSPDAKKHVLSLAEDLAIASRISRQANPESIVLIQDSVIEALKEKDSIEKTEFENLEFTLNALIKRIEQTYDIKPPRERAGGRKRSNENDKRPERERRYVHEETWTATGKVQPDAAKSGAKKLVIDEGRKKIELTEEQMPELRELENDDLIVVDRASAKKGTAIIVDKLGKAGTLHTEKLRLAYEIGNGRKFPPEVEAEALALEKKGEDAITEERERLEKEGKLVSAEDPNWRTNYKHGEGRVDFRKVLTMTIDPKSAKDFDDALSVRKVKIKEGAREKEYVEIGVHIADVTHFISMNKNGPGHAMFQEAMKRCFTAYFEGEAFPMLPKVLADQLCSLIEGKDRFAFSTVFCIDPRTKKIVPKYTWQGKTIINSNKRHTYEGAEELRTKKSVTSYEEESQREALQLLTEYGQEQRKLRQRRGAVEFPARGEAEAVYDISGEIRTIGVKKELEMMRVVADWMIRDNESRADIITQRSKLSDGAFPTFLRVHPAPSLDELELIAEKHHLRNVVKKIKDHRKRTPRTTAAGDLGAIAETDARFVNQIVKELLETENGDPEANKVQLEKRKKALKEKIQKAVDSNPKHELRGATKKDTDANIDRYVEERFAKSSERRSVAIREEVMELFMKAYYTTGIAAHFGLSAFPYTHATSPIRRIADGIVHSLLNEVLKGENVSEFNEASIEELQTMAARANAREIRLRNAARQSWRMRGADLLKEKIGSDIKVRVEGFLPRKGNLPPLVQVLAWPKGEFPISFRIPLSDFEGLPNRTERGKLQGREITVKLTGADVAKGTIKVNLVTAPVFKEAPRKPFKPDMVKIMRRVLLKQVTDMDDMFRETLTTQPKLTAELLDLKNTVEKNLTEKTPRNIVEGWSTRIGVLRVRLMYEAEMGDLVNIAEDGEEMREEIIERISSLDEEIAAVDAEIEKLKKKGSE